MHSKKLCNWLCISSQVGWLTGAIPGSLDSEAFGTDKGEDNDTYNEFGDRDDDESEDVEDDRAQGAGASAGLA